MNTSTENPKPVSGIKSINFFRDGAGRCCDRCGTFIKNVTLVTFKDGVSQSFGTECINKVLDGDNSLQNLWKKNAKVLAKWQSYLAILSRPVAEIPVDPRGYYGRGFYFIADDKGDSISCGEILIIKGKEYPGSSNCYAFHPTRLDENALASFDGQRTFDMRSCGLTSWEANTVENWEKKCLEGIESKKRWLTREIARIEKFLARILEKGLVKP